jgi:hypothetical protein
MSWRTIWHYPFLLKFNRREGFHQLPLTYDAQITVCPVKFFLPPKELGPIFNLMLLFVNQFLSVVRQKKQISDFWDLNPGPKSRLQLPHHYTTTPPPP